MSKVLVFGSLNIDHVYHVENMVQEGQTIQATSYRVTSGGKGLNQALAIARSGCEVAMAGSVGKDGAMLVELLKASNVDTSLLQELSAEVSGHAIIQLDHSGHNAIIIHPGANHQNSLAYIEKVLASYQIGDVLVLQNEINHLEELIARAHKRGMKVVLNPSPITPAILKLDMSQVDMLVVNLDEGMQLTGQSHPANILSALQARYPNLEVVLTLGADGVLAHINQEDFSLESIQVNAIDTTGAGDTFLGYLVGSLNHAMPSKHALQRGVVAAGLACTRLGAAASIPYAQEVDEWISIHLQA